MTPETTPSSSNTTLKACDTIPPPQNLAVRVGTRQLDSLKLHDDSFPNSHDSDDSLSSSSSSAFMSEPPSDSHLPPTVYLPSTSASSGFASSFDKRTSTNENEHNFIGAVGRIAAPTPVSPPRHLCMRHRRTADEGTNLKLGQSLNSLPIDQRQMINTLWSMFSSSPHTTRTIILQGILTMCCSSQLSLLSEQVPKLLRIDPFFAFPREISLRVLKYLDATSLARAAQVSRCWRSLADDDILWRNMCEQHIDTKCPTCGWGLPLLEKKRMRVSGGRVPASLSVSSPIATLARPELLPVASSSYSVPSSSNTASVVTLKRRSPFGDEDGEEDDFHIPSTSFSSPKRRRTEQLPSMIAGPSSSSSSSNPFSSASSSPYSSYQSFYNLEAPTASSSSPSRSHTPTMTSSRPPMPHSSTSLTRPWKDVYSERLKIERNWRRGRHTITTLKGHTDGVMCLQLHETLPHPSFPVLISGSYDRTVRVWNMETGQTVRVLTGHTRAVRALQFDEVKLITASMDRTLRVWNWRTGACVRVLEGHSEGVVSLAFDKELLVSGSVDTTVKVWNLRKGDCFTLRGHEDWVNSVMIWDPSKGDHHSSSDPSPSASYSSVSPGEHDLVAAYGSSSSPSSSTRARSPLASDTSADLHGKMVFSASDDCTIRLWDLGSRACVREFKGHVGQVQSIRLIYALQPHHGYPHSVSGPASASTTLAVTGSHHQQQQHPHDPPSPMSSASSSASPSSSSSMQLDHEMDDFSSPAYLSASAPAPAPPAPRPLLISGSLDNTLRLWDVETGHDLQTYFGHIEGVWAVATDKLRIVSASHDRTIKIWDRENDKSGHTLVGHRGAVTCLDLADDKIVSGSDDGDIRVWSFAPA